MLLCRVHTQTATVLCLIVSITAGLAVDWLNNKVYWSDRTEKCVFEYDLDTKEEKKVADLANGNPQKLTIFPQTDAG